MCEYIFNGCMFALVYACALIIASYLMECNLYWLVTHFYFFHIIAFFSISLFWFYGVYDWGHQILWPVSLVTSTDYIIEAHGGCALWGSASYDYVVLSLKYGFLPLFLVHIFTDYIEQMLYLVISATLFLVGVLSQIIILYMTYYNTPSAYIQLMLISYGTALIIRMAVYILFFIIMRIIIRYYIHMRNIHDEGFGTGDVILLLCLIPWIPTYMFFAYSVLAASLLGAVYIILAKGYTHAYSYRMSFAPLLFMGMCAAPYIMHYTETYYDSPMSHVIMKYEKKSF